MKNIKNFFLLIFGVTIVLSLFLFIYKGKGYKQDIIDLFGKDKYLIEIIRDDYIKFYSLNNKKEDGFDILSNYMNSQGYFNCPEKRLGALHYFCNDNGLYAECEANYYNNYIEWHVYLPEQLGDDSL